jgi:hypothetical protein
MAAEPQLTPACELAFAVATEGVEASPAIEPPAAMRSFLHVSELPRRALIVAQRAVDEDPAFRARVAEQATEDSVGRAGWLWLHRPHGWEAELVALTGQSTVTEWTTGESAAAVAPASGFASAPGGVEAPLLSDIERELDGLRALVSRLAVEQQNATTTAQLTQELDDRRAQVAELVEQLESTLAELDATRTEAAQVREDRDLLIAAVESAAAERERQQAEYQTLEARLAEALDAAGAVEQAGALARHQELVEDLARQLAIVEQERDELLAEVDRSEGRLDDARRALALASDALAPGLGAAASARALGDAVEVAVARLGELQQGLEAPAPAVEAAAVFAPAEPAGPVVEAAEAVAPIEPADLVDPVVEAAELFALVESAELTEPQVELIEASAEAVEPAEPVVEAREVFAVGEPAEPAPLGWVVDETPVLEAGDLGLPPTEELDALLAPYLSAERPTVAAGAESTGLLDGWPVDEATAPDVAAPAVPVADTDWSSLLTEADDDAVVERTANTSVDDLDWGATDDDRRDPWTNPGTAGSVGRRPVEVPLELVGDPVATARHLMTVPDVIVLIDGDSVASLGWPSLSLADRRDALVSYLVDLAGDTGAAPDVVFDGDFDGEQALPTSETVRVRLTAPGVTAVRAVADVIDTYPVDWPVVVVSDDGELRDQAAGRGASLLGNVELLDLFIAQ